MANRSILVDDSGRLWDINSFDLRSELNGFVAGDLFPAYVVKNLGFVRIDPRGQSATVWLRPATVASPALTRMVSWVSDEKIERVLVNSLVDGAWQHAMVGATEKLFTSIAGLISAKARVDSSPIG